jgi:hypothetical protein
MENEMFKFSQGAYVRNKATDEVCLIVYRDERRFKYCLERHDGCQIVLESKNVHSNYVPSENHHEASWQRGYTSGYNDGIQDGVPARGDN